MPVVCKSAASVNCIHIPDVEMECSSAVRALQQSRTRGPALAHMHAVHVILSCVQKPTSFHVVF